MLNVIQNKIENLPTGKKLILGAGIRQEELSKLHALCYELQSKGIVKVLNQQDKSLIIERL